MNTIEKLSAKLNAFVQAHGQLKSYQFCTRFKIDNTTQLYPSLVAMVKPSYIKNNSMELTMDILILDLLDNEESNLINVLSDTMDISADLVSWFGTWTGVGDFDVRLDESSVYLEPLLHFTSTELAGYAIRCKFIVPLALNYCHIPWLNGTPPTYPLG